MNKIGHCILGIVLALTFFGIESTFAFDLRVRGQIKGLPNSQRKTIPVVLDKVNITVMLDQGVVEVKSNLAGVYIVDLQRDKRYLMTVSRKDYNAKSVWINTHHLPNTVGDAVVELTDLDFLLLKTRFFPDDVSPNEDMGQFSFNPKSGKFQFSVNKDFRHGKEPRDQSLKWFKKTLTYVDKVESSHRNKTAKPRKINSNEAGLDADTTVEQPITEKAISEIILDESTAITTLEGIAERKKALDSAKISLAYLWENAKTKEDSLLVQRLEAQLQTAERDLILAENTILFQQKEINLQKRLVTIYISAALVLLLVLGFIFWLYRDKVKLNRELEKKNKVIIDGINYANTIQKSFLKTEAELKEILPGTVLFYRPRDIVSGDIYWATEQLGKVVIASIDCTGHGVPGAFISMIANTLLNEIVNNKKMLDPGKILNELHLRVLEVLQQEAGGKQAQDGMDMSLMTIDKTKKTVEFAGAKNHVYAIEDGKLEIVKADINSIGGRAMRAKDGFNKSFQTKTLNHSAGVTYYLFSDGYMDQFGGENEEKFNLLNFRELLIKCASLDFKSQQNLLETTFDSWIGNREQLDDVMVVGIKLD